jgi:hypothetical protein
MAVQNSGQASREDHHCLYSRSTEFPKWYCDPYSCGCRSICEPRGRGKLLQRFSDHPRTWSAINVSTEPPFMIY